MTTPATNRQIPDNAILDYFNKQAYLCNRYNFILSVTAGGTSEVAEILLQNPAVSGSSFPNQVALFVDLRQMSGLTASANNVMNLYLNPTVTSVGTAKTAQNMRSASANTSTGVLHSAPTVSGNGTLIETLSCPAFSSVSSKNLLILDPGQALLITLTTANAAVVNAAIGWYEL